MRFPAVFLLSTVVLTGVACVKSTPVEQTVTAATDSVAADIDSTVVSFWYMS